MQTTFYFRWLVALGLWLGTGLMAHATHILGGEITYAPIASTTAGVPRYRLTALLYCDPSPTAAMQPTLKITCSRGGCGTTAPGSFDVTVPYNQISTTNSLGCANSPLYSYKVLKFEVDVDLPAGQWTLSVQEYNRSADILNLVNPIYHGYYISAYLDNGLVGQNASPKFLSALLPYLCNGQAQRYSFATFESDGDSLVYQFVQPAEPSQITSVCSTPVPGTLSPHFQINAANGTLTAIPAPIQQGRYAMTARVSEYRRVNGSWQLIGYITRDIVYLAVASLNQTPRFTGLTLNGATTPLPMGHSGF
ncbi:MAG: hypothetical protein EOO62_26175 [Hymenobacter sp.]|nr:MAG: hypothetical protein EOO62_26175 [Hymenobacter sp.]